MPSQVSMKHSCCTHTHASSLQLPVSSDTLSAQHVGLFSLIPTLQCQTSCSITAAWNNKIHCQNLLNAQDPFYHSKLLYTVICLSDFCLIKAVMLSYRLTRSHSHFHQRDTLNMVQPQKEPTNLLLYLLHRQGNLFFNSLSQRALQSIITASFAITPSHELRKTPF